MSDITEWLRGRLPEEWFTGEPEVSVDREEVLVVGTLATPAARGEDGREGPEEGAEEGAGESAGEGGAEAAAHHAEAGRIARFREETRAARMRIADEAEARFGRKVAWGARCGGTRTVFTSLAVPVMTRLRQPERLVLDTLVEAGVARSRSEALAWCVRLVGQHASEWLDELRESLREVQRLREQGPAA